MEEAEEWGGGGGRGVGRRRMKRNGEKADWEEGGGVTS